MTTPPASRPQLVDLFHRGEWVLLVLALLVLWWFARGLAPGADGLAERYARTLETFERAQVHEKWKACAKLTTPADASATPGQNAIPNAAAGTSDNCIAMRAAFAREQQHSRDLNLHAFKFLAWLGLLGWVSLLIARWRAAMLLRLTLCAGLWAALGLWLKVLPASFVIWIGTPVLGFLVAEFMLWKQRGQRAWQSPVSVSTGSWLYPAWVLLTGLGLIWLLDVSARGDPKDMFQGLNQARALWVAYYAFALMAVLAPWLLQVVMHLFERVQRIPIGWVLTAALFGAALCLFPALQVPHIALLEKAAKRNAWLRWPEQHVTLTMLLLMVSILAAVWIALLLWRRPESGWAMWCADRLQEPRWSALALVLAIIGVAVAARVGGANEAGAGEIVRLVAWWVVAWFCYRGVERVHKREHDRAQYITQIVGFAVAVLAWCGALFLIVSDQGQTMAAFFSALVPGTLIAMMLLFGHWTTRRGVMVDATGLPRRSFQQAIVLVLCSGVVFAIYAVLVPALMHTGWLGAHVAERFEAMSAPYASAQDFLALLRWFADAGGWAGYGVGQVPWCGWLASLDGGCARTGVPSEIESDYAFNGLGAVFGYPIALLLVALTVAWLFRLARLPDGQAQRAQSAMAYRSWLLTWMALSLTVQAVMTVMGSTGLTLMTGITLPLLSFGATGLYVVAGMAGLSMNRWED